MGAMNQGQGHFYPRIFALVTAALLGIAVFEILRPFLGALLWASLLAFLVFPINLSLRRAVGGRRGAAASLLTLAVVLLIVVPALLVGVLFVAQASDLFGRLQATAAQYRIGKASDVFRIPAFNLSVRWIKSLVPATTKQIQDWMLEGGKGLLQALLSLSGSVFAGALDAFIGGTLALFLFFFFLRDGEEMVERGVGLIPMEEERKAHLVGHLAAVTRAVVLGSILTAIVQGILIGIGFAIAGLPSPIVFAVLGVGAALVPLVGTTIVWVPAAVVLAVQGYWGAATFMALWGALVVVAVADNFVRPQFISGRAEIATLPVFIGLLGGISAFGFIGMFLGPVVVALVLALIRFAEESRGGANPGG
jgi:predicted PurR-regulated permease PerM